MFNITSKYHWLAVPVVMVGLTLLAGCGDSKGLAKVQGTITKGGEPQEGLWIRFAPVVGGRPGNGRTDSSGRYEIVYSAQHKGAHVGTNKVTIGTGGELDGRGNQLSFPEEVHSEEVEVTKGTNSIDFELDL